MTRSIGVHVRTSPPYVPRAPIAPVDVAVSIRGVVYALQARTQPNEWGIAVPLDYKSVIAVDPRNLVSATTPTGGYVVAAVEAVHAAACHLLRARWSRKAKRKVRGTCDCGAQAAMQGLLANGRV